MPLRALIAALLLPPALALAALAAGCGAAAPGERGTLYVANLRSSDVSVIDLATRRETARIPVADNPHELVSALGGIVVSNYRSAAITLLPAPALSPTSGPGGDSPARTLRLDGAPHGLALAGSRLAVTLGRTGRVGLLDQQNGATLAEVDTGGEPHMAATGMAVGSRQSAVGEAGVTSDCRLPPADCRVYVVDAAGDMLVEIDVTAGAVSRRTAVGRTPEAVMVSPDGRTVAVANARSGDLSLVDAATMTERARVSVPGAPVRVQYSPNGGTLAVSLADRGTVALLDAGGSVQATVAVGERPDGLAFSPDGRLLYVALTGGRGVAVVRLADRRVIHTLPAGDGPSGLLLMP